MIRLAWELFTGRVFGETVLFVGETGERSLAFGLEELHRASLPRTGAVYEEGRDFVADRRLGTIRRLKGSRMPYLEPEALYPKTKGAVFFPQPHADAIGNAPGSPTGNVLFSDGDFFLRHAVAFDYTAKRKLPVVPVEPGKLLRFAAKVRRKELVKIAFIGDSITNGLNASGRVGVPPYRAPYPGLVAEWLGEKTPCAFCSTAVSGTGSQKGPEHLAEALKSQTPDLLFVAYGMNELGSEPAEFRQRIETILITALNANSDMEFVLISPMRKNQEWGAQLPDADRVIEHELGKIARGSLSIALAPVNRIWRQIEKRKTFVDLTGNGVNHPNDFGHAIYAQVVTDVLAGAIDTADL